MDDNERHRYYINSFHDDADKRLEFLPQLFSDGHQEEAMTLCLSYIDSFSQWLLWPNDKTGKNFVDAIVDFGEDPLMGLVHPLQAVKEFNRMKPFWKGIANTIKGIFPGPRYALETQDSFFAKLKPYLSNEKFVQIKTELWRTTMAAIAYFRLRNPAIHNFGPGLNISFSGTTHQGSPVPVLDFNRLHGIASNLHTELRRRSDNTGQFCGNDEIFGFQPLR